TPWREDPYDLVVSFALFFLPLVGGVAAVRLLLCRRDEPLPLSRVRGLVRAATLLIALIAITLVAEWSSVVFRENRPTWDETTLALMGVLAAATVAALIGLRGLTRAARAVPAAAPDGPDWLGDAFALARRWSQTLGPGASPATRLLQWLEDGPVT